jgi:hypothetical protein
MNTKTTPAKRARSRAATAAPPDITAAAEQEAVERAAERRAAAEKIVAATEGWLKVLKTAIKAADGEGARAAAEAVANGAGEVRRVDGRTRVPRPDRARSRARATGPSWTRTASRSSGACTSPR